jgi:uncharacterized protein (DUF2141 family)
LSQEFTADSEAPSHHPPTRWQENHGGLLILFFAFTLLAGGVILFYQQNRFVPVRFPDGSMIKQGTGSSEPSITIAVAGAANDLGTIKIAVFQSAADFDRSQKPEEMASVSIRDGVGGLVIPVEQLPASFAIAAFHDENNDGRLNHNRLGIPTERFGFSSQAPGYSGPPEFEQAVIDRPAAGETITIFIR